MICSMLFSLLLLATFSTFHSAQSLRLTFTKEKGTEDVTTAFFETRLGGEIHHAPIRGIECVDDCKGKVFHTVRYRNRDILPSMTTWTPWFPQDAGSGSLRLDCPKGSLMVTLQYDRWGAAAMQMLCSKAGPPDEFEVVPSMKKLIPVPSTAKSIYCPNGYYISSLLCTEFACRRFGMVCTLLRYKDHVTERYPILPFEHRMEWTNWFSEEYGGLSSFRSGPIIGMWCGGRQYCDNKALRIVKRGVTPIISEPHLTIGPISANKVTGTCPKGTVVAQIQCLTHVCADMNLRCSNVMPGYRVIDDDEKSSMVFSRLYENERKDIGYCPDGYVLKRVYCYHPYCQYMKLGCVLIQFEE